MREKLYIVFVEISFLFSNCSGWLAKASRKFNRDQIYFVFSLLKQQKNQINAVGNEEIQGIVQIKSFTDIYRK